MTYSRKAKSQNQKLEVSVQIWVAIIGAIGIVLAAVFAWFSPRPLEDAFAELTAQAIVRNETETAAAIQTAIAAAYTPIPTRQPTVTVSDTPAPSETIMATASHTTEPPSATPTLTLSASPIATLTRTLTSGRPIDIPTNLTTPEIFTTSPPSVRATSASLSTLTLASPEAASVDERLVTQPADTVICDSFIVPSESTSLNVVRALPSSNAPLVRPVQATQPVRIQEASVVSGEKWYRILYDDFKHVGWISAQYVVPQSECP